MPEFPVDGPITVAFKIASGSVDVVAEERATAVATVEASGRSSESRRIADETTVEFQNGRLTIVTPDQSGFRLRSGAVAIRVLVPLDSTVSGKSASADITCQGRVGGVEVESASGDVRAEHISGDATVGTASGDVRVGRVDGHLRTRGASGDLRVEAVGGTFTGKYASGDVQIDEAGGDISLDTASGDVVVRKAQRGTARISTASGDVSIGVLAGTGVWFDVKTLSGDTRNGLDMSQPTAETTETAGGQLTLQLRTMSGDIDIHRA
ncbi:hypothetical protein Ais01nite_50630 [Asanoa ishikariensis]|uniref:Putative adhesin n=1 Tax=Asanoa ishikariensis TaxID=137265 RepID=A0A1H3RMX7_9ACTN|nr:DUF4097 family beta strand repeat-containing protein [Asanoa ishikariensis]GIF67028.1 hypothetical protein Ais01nite_50630 [Asanoa ishikariensis]SDZ27104.1 Putative adhesin [Asanoa ishikariensis]